MRTRREILRALGIGALATACDPLATPSPTPSSSVTQTATSAPSTATPSPTPTPTPIRGTLVRAAALADGTAAAATRDVVVLIRGGRIVYAGPRDGTPDTSNTETVDLAGATVVPAMVDCHVHLTGTGGPNAHVRLLDPDAILLARGIENAKLYASTGVLGVRDVGAVRNMSLRVRDGARDRSDTPLIVASGTWIAKRATYVSFAVEVDDADQLLAVATSHLDAGADIVKIAGDGTTGSAATWTAAELRRVVDMAHARGKKVAVHCQGHGSRTAAEAGADTVEHGFVVDSATAALMGARTALVTSLSVAEAFGQLDVALPSIRAAQAAGVRIATGTDAGGAPPAFGQFPREVELLVRAGLPPHAALAAATRAGGAVMGVPGLGTLDAGAPASFLAVDGDPLADPAALRTVKAVFRAGERLL